MLLPIQSRQSKTIVIWTFVHATFVLAPFVDISNISPVTDPILTKLQSQFSGTICSRCKLSWWNLSRQHLTWRHLSLSAISQLLLNQFRTKLFLHKFFGPNFFWTQYFSILCFMVKNILDPISLNQTFLVPNTFWT